MKSFKYHKKISAIGIWDYNIKKLDLTDPDVIKWYLERKIEFNDWPAIDYQALKKFLPRLKVDPAKKSFLKQFIDWNESTYPATTKTA